MTSLPYTRSCTKQQSSNLQWSGQGQGYHGQQILYGLKVPTGGTCNLIKSGAAAGTILVPTTVSTVTVQKGTLIIRGLDGTLASTAPHRDQPLRDPPS